jgi:excisionase family DNA binding protein
VNNPTTISVPLLATLEEVASWLRVSDRTVRRYVESGKFPSIRVGNQWRVDTAKLLRQLQRSNRQNPTAISAE